MIRETEAFWAGEFGDEYTKRNVGRVVANRRFFHRAFFHAMAAMQFVRQGEASLLEVGCGSGENLEAVVAAFADARDGVRLTAAGIDLNELAVGAARAKGFDVAHGSFLSAEVGEADIVLAKGVLIHIAPDDLPLAYERIHRASARWILIAEYYNPVPVEVEYRGHAGRLWKRDFAGEMLERYPRLALVDYGFTWRRDPFCPQDDLTWFLLEKH